MIDRRLAHYRIVSSLGVGGMGEVFRATDEKLGRDVALKVLPEKLASQPERLYRFIQEAKTVAGLSHPNIVTLHSVDEADSVHFLTMELVEGKTLSQLLPPEGFPVARLLELAVPVAEALVGAHARGVVHRDLKPGNVMVTDDGHVKVLDFGLAKLTEPEPEDATSDPGDLLTRTKEGFVLGTPHYMAPEQARGRKVDHRADLFAFGVTLYEMATGRRPFEGESSIDLLSSVIRDEPDSVTAVRPDLPRSLGTIVARCMEKDPEDRFGSAQELCDALKALQREVTSGSFEIGDAAVPRRSARRFRSVAAVFGLIAVVAVVLVWRPWDRGEAVAPAATSARPIVAVLPFDNLGSDDDAYFADGMTDEITTRLSQVGDLGVISRTSARVYKDTQKSIREIGKELNTEYVLEGTIRWDRSSEPGRVRITPRLIRVSDDTQLWSEPYERDVAAVFDVQAEIATHIVDALGVTLLAHERAAIEARPTENIDAYQAYLRGMDRLRTPGFSRESFEVGVSMFERAVRLDEGFALAWARLSSMHSRMVHYGYDRNEERVAAALETARRSLQLAPDLTEAHLALGYFHYWVERDYTKALEALEDARALSPENSEVLVTMAYVKRRQGDMEAAIEFLEREIALSPLDANAAVGLGETYGTLRRYAEGESALRRAIALAPNDPYPYSELALLYLRWRGDASSARDVLDRMPPVSNSETCRVRFLVELLDREYDAALARLGACPEPVLEASSFYLPLTLLEGMTRRAMGDDAGAVAAFDAARVRIEERLAATPDDPRLHAALGMTLAGLGRFEEAVRRGRGAVELYPFSRDALEAPVFRIHLALTYAMCGEDAAAVEQLEAVLSVPSILSTAWLEADPRWDPLRGTAEYERLLSARR